MLLFTLPAWHFVGPKFLYNSFNFHFVSILLMTWPIHFLVLVDLLLLFCTSVTQRCSASVLLVHDASSQSLPRILKRNSHRIVCISRCIHVCFICPASSVPTLKSFLRCSFYWFICLMINYKPCKVVHCSRLFLLQLLLSIHDEI